jgi:hypothetical protein
MRRLAEALERPQRTCLDDASVAALNAAGA